jgi:Tfp pilus assembly ATPase PilU
MSSASRFDHVTGPRDLKALVGVAGSGKSTALAAMREAFEAFEAGGLAAKTKIEKSKECSYTVAS